MAAALTTRWCTRRFDSVEVIQAPRGRAAQMNAGAQAATGDGVLLFLHADTTLPPELADRLIAQALAGRRHVWGRFDVRIAGRSPGCCAWWRCS
jgi:glycosyltransferase involved in cell wall biosynthesis